MKSQPGAWSIRRFAGTLADAEGLLAVERATWGECPFTPEEVQARLQRPEQRAWVAEAGGQIVGFVCGLRTSHLAGPLMEADLLAVHPAWQRQGIATALLRALRRDAQSAGTIGLRGAVRPENSASERAFARAGFTPSVSLYDLFIYRILGTVPRPLPAWCGRVAPLAGPEEAAQLAALLAAAPAQPTGPSLYAASREAGLTVLVASRTGSDGLQLSPSPASGAHQNPCGKPPAGWREGDVVAAVELIQVYTLFYAGLWLEPLLDRPRERAASKVLAAAAVELAKERDLDEVGCLAPQGDRMLRAVLRGEGFVPLDRYRIWQALPLADGGIQS